MNVSFSDPGHQNYVSICGRAEVNRDKAKAKELWNPYLKAWFVSLCCFDVAFTLLPCLGFHKNLKILIWVWSKSRSKEQNTGIPHRRWWSEQLVTSRLPSAIHRPSKVTIKKSTFHKCHDYRRRNTDSVLGEALFVVVSVPRWCLSFENVSLSSFSCVNLIYISENKRKRKDQTEFILRLSSNASQDQC